MGKKSGSVSDDELPVAGWHRGLSPPQMKAADDLANALTFDIASTRDCLLRLGMRPLIKNRQLQRIVQLSRAQSLAFLFFLYQEHYKAEEEPCKNYSFNGQLLLSAIAYLDLPATYQALDKVLPLNGRGDSRRTGGQSAGNGTQLPPKPTRAAPSLNELQATNDQEYDLKATFRALDEALRTRSQTHSAATSRKSIASQAGGVNPSPYYQKQPRPRLDRTATHYVANPPLFRVQIPNELRDTNELDERWFASYQLHPLQRTVKAVINYELCHLFDKIDETPIDLKQNSRELCEFHQESRSQQRQTFLKEQRRRYLEMIDIEAKEKRLTKERIIHHLNRDVDEYLRKFGDKGWSPGVPVLRKSGCAACSELVHVSLEMPPQVLLLEGEWGRLCDRSGALMRLCAGQDSRRSTLKARRDPITGYFNAPKLHTPYILNYRYIFEKESPQKLDTNTVIGNSIERALDSDDDVDEEPETGVRNSLRTLKGNHINESISRCVRKIFEKSVLVTQMQSNSPKRTSDRLFYGDRTRFDPDDHKFMDQMLSDAFKVLQKDHKLVLVTLPDGHQLPELREWIRRRYGKRYGPQTEAEANKISLKMMELAEMEEKLGPLLANIDPRITRCNPIPFTLFDEIMKEANIIKKSFRDGVFHEILEQTRLCWQTQHSLRTLNSRGLHRTFFTYLPSCMRDAGPTISPFLAHKGA